MSVESSAYGGATERDRAELALRRLNASDVARECSSMRAKLLAEGERHRILEMRAADLHDVGPSGCLGADGGMQVSQ